MFIWKWRRQFLIHVPFDVVVWKERNQRIVNKKKKHYLVQKLIFSGTVLAGIYAVMRECALRHSEPESIDEENPYFEKDLGKSDERHTTYESIMKPIIDKVLSFGGLILLLPVFVIVSIAIYIDDPGPVFFIQKRVGKGKNFFLLHKFRTMKMSTPHDVPTHQLSNPEQYITRVGKVLRKTSLDELPQIWDIFRGKMSIIGPRPALWNQEDLVEERDKYGANDIYPGLTGLAQIKGRDELEIYDKAKVDGEYTEVLHAGGIKAAMQDVICFISTIGSVLKHDGVVEGGTGSMQKVDPSDVGFEEYAYKKAFHIDKTTKRKVLITGANSYIGESFTTYANIYYPNISVNTIDMIDGSWREYDFSQYDSIFHVAGIAHTDVGKVSEERKKQYYEINTDLAIETAKVAKKAGVKQFIFMSSMIIYGDSAPYGKEKIIDEYTVPDPTNFYGDSKWRGDVGVRKLADDSFFVAVLRPPMIYGRESKGNYPLLSKLAKILPVFPSAENKRSMLYIENLCEFISLLMLSGEGGIYFPQNEEFVNTATLVKEINKVVGKKIYISGIFNPAVRILSHLPGKIGKMTEKAFGNLLYSQQISTYEGLDYHVVNSKKSVIRTEGKEEIDLDSKRHILVISQYFYPETFRINDMAMEWVKRGYKVTVLTGIPNYPMGKFFEGYDFRHRRREKWNGVEIIRLPLIPRGNSFAGMIANYISFVISGFLWNAITDLNADLVFTFEVSPMTQALIGCWYAKKHYIPHYLYVTDLWPENVESVTGIHNKAIIAPLQKLVDYIYRNSDRILTCSQSFIKPIKKRGVNTSKIEFWPQYVEDFYKPVRKKGELLPQDGILNLVFAGNVGYAQGLGILVETAKRLKKEKILVRFNIIGDGRYMSELLESISIAGVKCYFNFIPRLPSEEIPNYLAFADALLIILSKSDAFSITIPAKTQSCMACGRPILLSADGEVMDIIRESNAGLYSNAEDIDGFIDNIKVFMEMSAEQRERLAVNALIYSEEHFNKKKLMGRLDEIFQGVIS